MKTFFFFLFIFFTMITVAQKVILLACKEQYLFLRGACKQFGHGFGLVNPSTKENWMERLIPWLQLNGFYQP